MAETTKTIDQSKLPAALLEVSDDMALDPVRGFVPSTVADLKRMALMLSGSQFCPACFQGKPAECFLALNQAIVLRFDNLILGVQDMMVVNGKVSMYGNSCRGLLMNSGLCTNVKEEWFGEFPEDEFGIRITLSRKEFEDPFVGVWTVNDEKIAGLWGANVHAKYPKDMMYWRAWHRAAGRGFSDVLKGLVPREIMHDFEVIDITPKAEPPSDLDAAAEKLKEKGKTRRSRKKKDKAEPVEKTPEPETTKPDGELDGPDDGVHDPGDVPGGEAPVEDPPEGDEPEGTEADDTSEATPPLQGALW